VTSPTPQVTDFTRDVLGRYICNGLDEARASADTSLRPDARPFDVLVVGGGSFGAAFAQHLFFRDQTHSRRILVLEAGPFLVPEQVQNLPMLGLDVPGPTSIKDLRDSGQYGRARAEVWGLAWHSNVLYTGLAYCLGGRSLYWGGWAPQLLNEEMPLALWPQAVVDDLNTTYFPQAAEQLGVDQTNDFISGKMHEALRERLATGIGDGKVRDAIPLNELPLHLKNISSNLKRVSKLEAPLAVQSRAPRPGFFAFNKFSDLPLLIKAARASWSESGGDDVLRRLMVVPNCHVTRLRTSGGVVTSVETNQGAIGLPAGGIVVLAAGTIESARLALLSFPNEQIGRNLMAHLRSNLTIRIPRAAYPQLAGLDLEASALFVKGRHQFDDGTTGSFHLQITAAGLGKLGADSEAELFKKVPDIDEFHKFRAADEQTIVVTIRGIGEMQHDNPNSHVSLDPEADEYGVQRAFVALADPRQPGGNPNDLALWDAMDAAAHDVASVLANGQPFETLGKVRDALGSTHHDAGTLRIGDDPASSATDASGRFHHVENAYAVGPALHPTIGSPNPMLTGVALARRLADQLAPPPVPAQPEGEFQPRYDGFSLSGWRMLGPGRFVIVDGALEAIPGGDLGLLWNTEPMPTDFILKLEWRRWSDNDNSGVFVRFPDPTSKGYNNPAWVAVNFGYEIQIDELGRPDGAPEHRTGAIYGQADQIFNQQPARPPGEWNEFEIQVEGQSYTVHLNGAQVSQFENHQSGRGGLDTGAQPTFIGLQAHTGRVSFRNIRVAALAAVPVAATSRVGSA
jgi:choline dehydrogenase-like flavoprotein